MGRAYAYAVEQQSVAAVICEYTVGDLWLLDIALKFVRVAQFFVSSVTFAHVSMINMV